MKQKLTKKFYILTSIFGTLLVAVGIAGGMIIGQEVFASNIDYGAIDVSSIEDDQIALMKKYERTSSSAYKSTFKPYEFVNISLNKLGEYQSIHKVTTGAVVAAGVTQDIRSNFVKEGDNYFMENLSQSSMVKVAWRFYQDKDSVEAYKGSLNNIESAKWKKDSKEDYNLTDYEETWGKTLDKGSIYIISSKTVTSGDVKETDDGYEVTIELDTSNSVVRYVKQMMQTSNLSKPPVFHDVKLTYTLDKDLNLLKSVSDESYDVYMFGKHNSKGHVVDTYIYEDGTKIPSLTEDALYEN